METTFDLPERREHTPRVRQKTTRRMPQEMLDELAARYLDGVQTPELSEQFKLSRSTVLKVLRDAGVPIRRQGLPADKVAEAVALYEGGLSLAKVAEHFSVSVTAVYNKLRAAGVPMRDSGGRDR
jgi:DNA-directed RNA polymerase specialized sigma24 family protein